ncbi:hypothetical protein [Catenulispora rubra]|uniref:hypothetical protein n=1 Tax=Catenulispora rubra TaxID=280293 RepID=UPI0018922048|nr:hypothetical protein [Catenulispora rubra]
MPGLKAAFGFDESWTASYQDPATHRLPQDMGSYMKQNIDTYPGLDCALMGLLVTSNPLSAAEIQVRPYDAFWVNSLLFSAPGPAQQCTDLHIPGQVRSQGCWTKDGTYLVSLATAKVMIIGTFSLYQAPERFGELRDAVNHDLTRIAAAV